MINEIWTVAPDGVETALDPRDLTFLVEALCAELAEETKESGALGETYGVGIVNDDAGGVAPGSKPCASGRGGDHGSETGKGVRGPFEEG